MRRPALVLLVVIVCLVVLPTTLAHAEDATCFAPTRQCFSGRFQTWWQQNGGLPVFGYPIAPAINAQQPGNRSAFRAQQFERNRLEAHPEHAAPYDVQLARLGDDRLRQLGTRWQTLPRESGPQAGCLWFAETGHNVCDQQAGIGFRSYWENHGLRDGRLSAHGRSLALFGFPLTGVRTETNASGATVLTQWFERARFEWHPQNPASSRVLLGLLGSELRDNAQPAPPTRLIIPAIGLDVAPVAVGVDASNTPIVPRHDAGWFAGSAAPGGGSNIVFWGHVLRWQDSPGIPAPFARLKELRPGAEITLMMGSTAHRYRVVEQRQVRPSQVDVILPTPSERVTLVSCIGDNVIREGMLTKEFRLITIAEPIR